MAQKITKGIKKLLAEANAVVPSISVEEAAGLLNSQDHVFIDLRDIRELQRSGKIPNAFSCPRGMLEFWIDPESPYHKELFNQDKTYVFYCASAWRSALSAQADQIIRTCRYQTCEKGSFHARTGDISWFPSLVPQGGGYWHAGIRPDWL